MTSPDGVTWTSINAPNINVYTIADNGDIIVAVGTTAPYSMWSNDGVTWTTTSSTLFAQCRCISYSPSQGLWVTITTSSPIYVYPHILISRFIISYNATPWVEVSTLMTNDIKALGENIRVLGASVAVGLYSGYSDPTDEDDSTMKKVSIYLIICVGKKTRIIASSVSCRGRSSSRCSSINGIFTLYDSIINISCGSSSGCGAGRGGGSIRGCQRSRRILKAE